MHLKNLFAEKESEEDSVAKVFLATASDEKPEPDSPDWHGDILAERRRKIESGEARFISFEEAKRRIEE